LLHDIAKGRGGDHSVLGAEVAEKLGPRLGLTEWETETVSWLVRWHLMMSHTAFKRDLDDPKTVSDFAEEVQSPERLRMLLVLTVADIRAVGPGVWNTWKAGLLRELYWRTQEVLSGGAPEQRRTERVARAKAHLRARLDDWTPDAVEAHLQLGQPGYWLGVEPDTLVRHAAVIRAAEAAGEAFRIEIEDDPERGISEVTVYAPDHPGLFAAIAGALSLSRASVVDAKINTLNNGMALDTFSILLAAGDGSARASDQDRLRRRIADAIQGKVCPAREFAERDAGAVAHRTQVFKVPPRVLIDNKASNTHTVIEINGRDRTGFLHDVTQVLTDEGLQISSAHIATFGERVVDVFYVKDVFGLKIDSDAKTDTVRRRLLQAVAAGAAADAAAAE
ncbi:MAG: ACT domain-containing protein, partial [Rhodospirillaceae bacterium]